MKTFPNRSKLSLLALLLGSLVWGCSPNPDTENVSTPSSLGSWSTMVGGTLAELSDYTLANVQAVSIYHVFRPAGLGITHEYLGLRLTFAGYEEFVTTGLVGDGDDQYFRDGLQNRRRVRQVKQISRAEDAQSLLLQWNQTMASSPYHNRAYYLSAMTLTPLLGRPCANTVTDLKSLL